MLEAKELVLILDKFVSGLLDSEVGELNYDITSLEEGNPAIYFKVIDYLNAKRILLNDQLLSLADDIIDVWANEEWVLDEDDDRPSEFKKISKKVVKKLESLKVLLNNKKSADKKNSKSEQEEHDMNIGNFAGKVLDTVVDDSKEIAIRMGAQQLAKGVREPLAAMLLAQLGLEDNNSTRAKIAGFLNSDIGLGLVSLVCSVGIKSLPLPGVAREVMDSLGKELRLQAEMSIATPVVEMVSAPMRYLLTEQVLLLPIPGLKKPAQLVENVVPVVEIKAEPMKKAPTTAKKAAKKVVEKVTATVKKNKVVKNTNNFEIKVKEIPTIVRS